MIAVIQLSFIIAPNSKLLRSIAENVRRTDHIHHQGIEQASRSQKIIQKVCEQGSLNWKEAERLFILVEARHKNTIVIPRTPVLLFWSIGMLIIGFGLLAYNAEILFAVFQKDVLKQILSVRGDLHRMIELLAGVGITAIGLASLWKALGSIFPNR